MASAVVENRPLVLLEWDGRGGGGRGGGDGQLTTIKFSLSR